MGIDDYGGQIHELLKADTTDMHLTYLEANMGLREAFNDSLSMDCGPTGIEITDSTPQFGGMLYEDLATIYKECGIKGHFGITLDEFLGKTREQRITLQRLSVKFSKVELTAAEEELLNNQSPK